MLVCLGLNVFSQGFSGGLFFGPTTSWISSDSRLVNTSRIHLGYNFGAQGDIRIFDNFDLSLGLQFNNIGGSFSFAGAAFDIKPEEFIPIDTFPIGNRMDFNLNYIAVPIGFKGKTNEIGYITYFLKAGATPMVNLKAKADIPFVSDNYVLVNEHVRLLNIGWHIGGGIEYGLTGNTRLLVEVLYTGGLMDFSKFKVFDESRNAVAEPKTVLNDIHLKIGVLF